MQNHYKIMSALQIVAKSALDLAGKFNSPDYSKMILESYQDGCSRNATRSDVQQQVCDMKMAVDDAIRLLENEGFKNVLERYNQE